MKKSGNTNSHWPLLCFLIGMLFLITCGREWNSVLDPESDLPVDGLVAYYPFNGNAEDESERAQHGTVSGATLAEDRFGNQNRAYYFDGHSYIKASANGLPTDVRTVSLWFYANSLYTIHIILGYGGNSAWGGPGSSWFMGVDGVHFQMSTHYGSNEIKYYYASKPLGTWVHFIVTTDPTGSKLFINGERKATNTTFVSNTYVSGKDLAIGVDVSANGRAPYTDGNVGYFVGRIDDIRIYNRALDGREIQALYHENGWPK
ncbi:MAG TPA: LamG domain-containing protein [bacterium]|jgi:hypothetical protein|nr:LamG domain-containing protein [bacterium]